MTSTTVDSDSGNVHWHPGRPGRPAVPVTVKVPGPTQSAGPRAAGGSDRAASDGRPGATGRPALGAAAAALAAAAARRQARGLGRRPGPHATVTVRPVTARRPGPPTRHHPARRRRAAGPTAGHSARLARGSRGQRHGVTVTVTMTRPANGSSLPPASDSVTRRHPSQWPLRVSQRAQAPSRRRAGPPPGPSHTVRVRQESLSHVSTAVGVFVRP